ncbi:hypothetical protein MRX96_035718 [Rhipicephalus microplus]
MARVFDSGRLLRGVIRCRAVIKQRCPARPTDRRLSYPPSWLARGRIVAHQRAGAAAFLSSEGTRLEHQARRDDAVHLS